MNSVEQTRRGFLKKIALGAAGLSLAPWKAGAEAKRGKRPNFVFFLVDDLGWADVGCFGSRLYETPNIDRLAAEGVRFTDAYASCPVCSPTRASIMTGQYPARVGITDWIPGSSRKNPKLNTPQDKHELALEHVTIAEALRQARYKTYFAGKWHLGSEPYWPEHQGFDINKGGMSKGSPPGGYFSPYTNPRLKSGPKGEYLTDRLAEESVQFLDSVAAKPDPFLLYFSFYTVHTPLQGKKEVVDKYKKKIESKPTPEGPTHVLERENGAKQRQDNATYASMVESMDAAVGRVTRRLEKLGIADETVIIFTSDNGGLSTLPGKWRGSTSNLPLRAGKGWIYEGGIRVPTFIKWPGKGLVGAECAEPVTSTDFYPTLLEMAGLPKRPDLHVDGQSLAPLVTGSAKSLDREAIYWHYPHYHGSGSVPSGAVRAGDFKLIEWYEDGAVELYNLKKDIGEKQDLAKRMPKKTAKLRRMFSNWRKEVGAEMPTPNPAYDPGAETTGKNRGKKAGK